MRTRTAFVALLAVALVACGGDGDPGTTQAPGETQPPGTSGPPVDDDPASGDPTTTTSSGGDDETTPQQDQPPTEASTEAIGDYLTAAATDEWGELDSMSLSGGVAFNICRVALGAGSADDETLDAVWRKTIETGVGSGARQTMRVKMNLTPPQELIDATTDEFFNELESYASTRCGTHNGPYAPGEWVVSQETFSGVNGMHTSISGDGGGEKNDAQTFVAMYRGVFFNVMVDVTSGGGSPLGVDVPALFDELLDAAVSSLDQ